MMRPALDTLFVGQKPAVTMQQTPQGTPTGPETAGTATMTTLPLMRLSSQQQQLAVLREFPDGAMAEAAQLGLDEDISLGADGTNDQFEGIFDGSYDGMASIVAEPDMAWPPAEMQQFAVGASTADSPVSGAKTAAETVAALSATRHRDRRSSAQRPARVTASRHWDSDTDYAPSALSASPPPATQRRGVPRNEKNAIAARENRARKKHYIQTMEAELKRMQTINQSLNAENARLRAAGASLAREVVYLKSVISNETVLGKLLVNLKSDPGIAFTAGPTFPSAQSALIAAAYLTQERPIPPPTDHAAGQQTQGDALRSAVGDAIDGGVCMHVHRDRVTLELCSQCNSARQQLSKAADGGAPRGAAKRSRRSADRN